MAKLPRGIRPSSENVYPIALALASLRHGGLPGWATFEGVPSEVLERAAREARVLTSRRLLVDLHQVCQRSQPQTARGALLARSGSILAVTTSELPDLMTTKEMLPQMKQHLADGDAAFERLPRLIAYPRSLQGSGRNSRP